MKNLYFILIISFINGLTHAQTIYSHVQSFQSIGPQSFVCAQDGTGIMLGNSFAVGYDLQKTFGVNHNVDISGVELLVATTDENRELTINLYESNSLDIATASLNLVRSKVYTFTDYKTYSGYRTIHFDQPYTVTPGTILAVEIVIESDLGKSNSPFFLLGSTTGPVYTGMTYAKAPNCEFPEYIDTEFFFNGYQDDQYVINLVAGNLAVDNIYEEKPIEVYPNPASNYINVKLHGNDSIKDIALYNAEGKKIPRTLYNDQIDVSNLPSGIYTLKLLTEGGSISRKVIVR